MQREKFLFACSIPKRMLFRNGFQTFNFEKDEWYIRSCSFSRREQFLQVIYHFRVEDLEKDQTENSFSILFIRVRIYYRVGVRRKSLPSYLITPIVSSMGSNEKRNVGMCRKPVAGAL